MKKFIKEAIPYVAIILVVVLVRTFIATPVRVDGDSMLSYLHNNEILVLYKLGKIKRYDIVVLKEDTDDNIIKRIYGMPGETISIKNNNIYINGKKIEDKYGIGDTDKMNEVTLKENEYFVLGDNREVSKDSRLIGPIKKENIKGKTIFRLFPFTKFGVI